MVGDEINLNEVGSLIVNIICWGIKGRISNEGWDDCIFVKGVFLYWDFVLVG